MRWKCCRESAPAAIIIVVIIAAGMLHLPVWYLLVWLLGLTNLLLIALWYSPRKGFVVFQAIFYVVWTPFVGLIDLTKLQLPKPYLYADGEATHHRKEIVSIVRRCVFIMGASMSVHSTEMLMAVTFLFLLSSSFSWVFRELLRFAVNAESETAREELRLDEHGIDTDDYSISGVDTISQPCYRSTNVRSFLAINMAVFASSFIYTLSYSISLTETFFTLIFAIVTDIGSQRKAMAFVKNVRPYSFDGLLDYVVLAGLVCVDFLLCLRLFVYVVYRSYGLVAICLAYCNAFAAVMEFSTKVWLMVRDELSLISSMRRASCQELRLHNDVCAICLARMRDARVTPCNHLFHGKCLRLSLRNTTSCPLCQAKLVATQNTGHAISVF